MANKLFQLARNAVNQALGRSQNHKENHEEHAMMSGFSKHDMEVAQEALSSAMAQSSDAERAQLADLQKELDGSTKASSSQTSITQQVLSDQGSQEATEQKEDPFQEK